MSEEEATNAMDLGLLVTRAIRVLVSTEEGRDVVRLILSHPGLVATVAALRDPAGG